MRQKVLKIPDKEVISMTAVPQGFGMGVASVMRWSKNIDGVKKPTGSTQIDMETLKRHIATYPDA
jgi:hypothetical protein